MFAFRHETEGSKPMQLNFVYDASVANAPAGFLSAMNYVATDLDNLITNNITVTIQVGWGEDIGTPITTDLSTGGPQQAGIEMPYAQLRAALTVNATSAADQTMLANLPATDPTNGAGFYVTAAQQQAWGLLPANGILNGSPIIDGNIGFNANDAFSFDPNARAVPGQYDFIGDAEAEITHALGRFPDGPGGLYSPLDLLRYASPGVNIMDETHPGASAYLSIDGGNTNLGALNATANGGGDPSDFASTRDAFGNGYTDNAMLMTATDKSIMDVLGFNVAAAPPVTTTLTSSQTITGQNNGNYLLVSGPQLPTWKFLNTTGDDITVLGNKSHLTLSGSSDTVDDSSNGLALTLRGAGNVTLIDFGHDKTGSITLYKDSSYRNGAAALANLVSDGHGGSLLALTGGSLDLVGVTKADVSASQFKIVH
jgi:hypothetical protein